MLTIIIRKNLGAMKMWSIIIIIVNILNYLYNRCSGGVLSASGGYRLGGATFLLFILLNIAYQKMMMVQLLQPLTVLVRFPPLLPLLVLFLRPNRAWTSINFSCSIQVIE